MHAYRQFIENEMDRRGWKAADLAKASGVSKQVLGNLLKGSPERLRMLPPEETDAGLARAVSVPEAVVLHKVAEAMGLPISEPVQIVDASRVPSSELIRELERRLEEGGGERERSAPMDTADGEKPAQDNVTALNAPDPDQDLEDPPAPPCTSPPHATSANPARERSCARSRMKTPRTATGSMATSRRTMLEATVEAGSRAEGAQF